MPGKACRLAGLQNIHAALQAFQNVKRQEKPPCAAPEKGLYRWRSGRVFWITRLSNPTFSVLCTPLLRKKWKEIANCRKVGANSDITRNRDGQHDNSAGYPYSSKSSSWMARARAGKKKRPHRPKQGCMHDRGVPQMRAKTEKG
eukprot:47770-Pelagomonas_calceolata.AAC.3